MLVLYIFQDKHDEIFSIHPLSNGGGEIEEPSVILSSYLGDIYICVLSFFATLPLWHLGTRPAEPSATSVQLSLTSSSHSNLLDATLAMPM